MLTKQIISERLLGLYLNVLSYVNPVKAMKIAYYHFSSPRYGKLDAAALPGILKKSDQETLSFNGHQVQSYTWGSGPKTILLLHGWESNASRWELLLPYLKDPNNTVIAIDAPGHGLSSGTEFNVPLYGAFIEKAVSTYKPSALIGHSMGGITVSYYLSHFENNSIEKAVVLGAPSEMRTIVDNFYTQLRFNTKSRKHFEKHILDRFGFTIDSFSGSTFAKRIRAKGLVGHDSDDQIVSVSEGRQIAEAWPNAVFHETKGSGHSIHNIKLYEQLREFLLDD